MIDFDPLYDQQRNKFKRIFEKKHKKMQVISDHFAEKAKKYRADGWLDHAEVWKVALFLNMAAHDISVLVHQITQERDQWSRRLAVRHAALATYESMRMLARLMGQPLRVALENLGLLTELDGDLRQARKPLDEYSLKNSALLKEIRVISAAHRSPDALELYNSIAALAVDEMYDRVKEFGDLQNTMGPAIQAIMNRVEEAQPTSTGDERAYR